MEEKPKKVRERFYEPKCPSTCPIYQWEVDKDGHHIQKQVGTKKFDDEIQLYKDACDIKVLVDRMSKEPQLIDILKQQAEAMPFGDVNNYPEEYHPAAGAQALKTLYENQPDAVKEKFPTYEIFEKYFTNLTQAAIDNLFAPKEEPKEEAQVNE